MSILYFLIIGAISAYAGHRYFSIARGVGSDFAAGAEAVLVMFSVSAILVTLLHVSGVRV